MGTVQVDYYDARCARCGWRHSVMYGGGLGTQAGHDIAVVRHASATGGRCAATRAEIVEDADVPAVPAREPQGHTIRAISHGPTLTERAQRWQREHAAANTPTPDETYLLVRDFLVALDERDDETCDCGHRHSCHTDVYRGCQTACSHCGCLTFAAAAAR